MKRIALLHSDTKLVNIVFDLANVNQKIYNPTFLSRPNLTVKRDSGRSLNGQGYSHILHKYRTLSVTLSADVLNEAEITFIETFLSKPYKYIAIQENNVWSGYIEVLVTEESTPITYIDELIELPEITLNFEYINIE